MTNFLKNKIAFITGATSGIGKACAEKFAKEGVNLILIGRRTEKLEKLSIQLIESYKIKIFSYVLDITNKDQINLFFKKIPKFFKNIDFLINNAGLALGLDKFQESELDDTEKMIDTNIKGLLYITHKILPHMIKKNEGHIINLGSISGHGVYQKGIVYCATKHAVHTLTQGLRMDLSGTNIKVSLISPGMVKTEFSLIRTKGNKKLANSTYEGFQPLLPEDIANSIIYCLNSPPHVNIDEIIIMPLAQAALSMTARAKIT